MSTIAPVTLYGPRLCLKPVSIEGIEDFHEYSINENFYRYFEYPPFKDKEICEEYLNNMIDQSKFPNIQYWFIENPNIDKIVGSFCVRGLDSQRKSCEIGYGVSPLYWRQGIFTEAGQIVVDHLIKDLNLHRIVAKTSAENQGSISGLRKLGFKKEGIMRDYYKKDDGIWFDAVLMSLLSTDQMFIS